MASKKKYLNDNVFCASQSRIEWIFNTFDNICISFSGGKDSTVLMHLVANAARHRNKKISVLFIDWEAQFQCTIEHILKMKSIYNDVINDFYWVALPLTTVNGVSQYQPEWICWDRGIKWVRSPPAEAITDENFFPFYRYAMTFEEFVIDFATWFSKRNRTGTVILTGIRAEESLNRFNALINHKKLRYADDKPWTTASLDGFSYVAYPIYDWQVKDIWSYTAKNKVIYNHLYELMHCAGVPLRTMRICEPFGPEQRKGLWLYHVLDPVMWSHICERVMGANSGAAYGNESGPFYALRTRLVKPAGHTWRSYSIFLLDSMPTKTAEHYRTKIAIYLHWYKTRGFPFDIPDEQEKDLGCKDIPSWRRICKVLLKNDYWCRNLSFSPTKPSNYKNYILRMKRKRKSWGII